MSLPILLASAGILNGFLKSQQYYPAAQAPSRAQIYGDILGGGLGGYLGGASLGGGGGGDPLGILGLLGSGGRPQDIRAEDVTLPTQAGIPAQDFGRARPSGGLSADDAALFELLTNGGFSGQGLGQYTRPQNQNFAGLLSGLLG